jgi:hypothetical protein
VTRSPCIFTNGIAQMLSEPVAPAVVMPNALVINWLYKHSTETTSNISKCLHYGYCCRNSFHMHFKIPITDTVTHMQTIYNSNIKKPFNMI